MAHPRPWVSRDGEGKHLATSARPHRRLSKRTANVGMARVPAEGLGARSIHATMLGVVGERLPLASTDNVAARNNRPLALRTRIPAVQQGSEQRIHCRRPSFCVRAEDEAHWLEQHCQLWHLLQQPNARLGRHGSWQPGRHGRTLCAESHALAAARVPERRAGVRASAARRAAFRVSAATPSRRAFRDDQFLNTYVACGLEFVPDLSPRTCVGRDVQRDARPDALDSVAGNVSPPPVTSAVGPAERLPEN